ncbi:hypothetical protein [Sphingosinicella sp. BN140058]|nr:hypothetical protein [Sphingosinicella sp. BN140058]
MSSRLFLYGLWCLAITGIFVASGFYAWSPFADGGRVGPRAGMYGPTHK